MEISATVDVREGVAEGAVPEAEVVPCGVLPHTADVTIWEVRAWVVAATATAGIRIHLLHHPLTCARGTMTTAVRTMAATAVEETHTDAKAEMAVAAEGIPTADLLSPCTTTDAEEEEEEATTRRPWAVVAAAAETWVRVDP